MKTATSASNRTAWAASKSLNKGLQVALRSGAVMGLVVVGFGLLDIAIWFLILNSWVFTPEHMDAGLKFIGLTFVQPGTTEHEKLIEITAVMLTFGMGASTQALFARVGGGIFTKAADVGADLVGKVEAGIPEDDPRNPATIADNVGDNVGDVAGMGSDLFESYVGSLVGGMILGAGGAAAELTCPLARRLLGGERFEQGFGALQVALSFLAGLATGVLIGILTEFFTGAGRRPVRDIVKAAQTGAATTIITGIGVGTLSSMPAVLLVAAGLLGSPALAGLYGVGIAALGMLSTLGIQLAVDAYGPIAET